MACRFRPVDRNASAVLHIEKHLFSRARGDKNSGSSMPANLGKLADDRQPVAMTQ
jgi:hypothetical protein